MLTNKASSYQVHTTGIAFGMAKRQCQENVIPSHPLPPFLTSTINFCSKSCTYAYAIQTPVNRA